MTSFGVNVYSLCFGCDRIINVCFPSSLSTERLLRRQDHVPLKSERHTETHTEHRFSIPRRGEPSEEPNKADWRDPDEPRRKPNLEQLSRDV